MGKLRILFGTGNLGISCKVLVEFLEDAGSYRHRINGIARDLFLGICLKTLFECLEFYVIRVILFEVCVAGDAGTCNECGGQKTYCSPETVAHGGRLLCAISGLFGILL